MMREYVAMYSAGGLLSFDQACRRPTMRESSAVYHGMCQDDGPGASTVLGASWMMHQDTICTATCCYVLHTPSFRCFTLFHLNTACHGMPTAYHCTSWPARCSQDVIFDMPQQMVGSRRVAVSPKQFQCFLFSLIFFVFFCVSVCDSSVCHSVCALQVWFRQNVLNTALDQSTIPRHAAWGTT